MQAAAARKSRLVPEQVPDLRLSLALPEGYSYTEQVSDAGSLLGQIASQDPAAPVLAVAVAFNDNETYIAAESLKDLSKEALDSMDLGI